MATLSQCIGGVSRFILCGILLTLSFESLAGGGRGSGRFGAGGPARRPDPYSVSPVEYRRTNGRFLNREIEILNEWYVGDGIGTKWAEVAKALSTKIVSHQLAISALREWARYYRFESAPQLSYANDSHFALRSILDAVSPSMIPIGLQGKNFLEVMWGRRRLLSNYIRFLSLDSRHSRYVTPKQLAYIMRHGDTTVLASVTAFIKRQIRQIEQGRDYQSLQDFRDYFRVHEMALGVHESTRLVELGTRELEVLRQLQVTNEVFLKLYSLRRESREDQRDMDSMEGEISALESQEFTRDSEESGIRTLSELDAEFSSESSLDLRYSPEFFAAALHRSMREVELAGGKSEVDFHPINDRGYIYVPGLEARNIPTEVEFSIHSLIRMYQRFIPESEVIDTLKNGTIYQDPHHQGVLQATRRWGGREILVVFRPRRERNEIFTVVGR